LKKLVARLDNIGLSAKTIVNYTGLMKLVVSSAVDENTGEPLYPRKWNHNFADMPIVRNQKQPTFSEEAMSSIARSRGTYQVLFTLLAATGMRIGEALGLDIGNIDLDGPIIKITASAWRSELQAQKTRAAVREIDVAESIGDLLREFIGDRKSGLLFKTKSGKPLSQSNIIRRHLHPLLKELGITRTGFHAFRRFRTTWLRKLGAPEDLVKLWLGHAEVSIYRPLQQDQDGCGIPAEKNRTHWDWLRDFANCFSYCAKCAKITGSDGSIVEL
jgi:integrase